MKYSICFLIVGVLITTACNAPKTENNQKDRGSAETMETTPGKGDNQVRSEAPDAVTKNERGYA